MVRLRLTKVIAKVCTLLGDGERTTVTVAADAGDAAEVRDTVRLLPSLSLPAHPKGEQDVTIDTLRASAGTDGGREDAVGVAGCRRYAT